MRRKGSVPWALPYLEAPEQWTGLLSLHNKTDRMLYLCIDMPEQLKMECFSTAYKGINSGAEGWCQILSCTWCISRDLAGSLAKTEHVFVHIQHPLQESLCKLLLRLCLAPEAFHRKIQHIPGDILGRDSEGLEVLILGNAVGKMMSRGLS